jgi:Zn-dependent protease with chaperone function
MKRQILHGLQARLYEHPFDRNALNALRGMPGVESLVARLNEWGIERFLRIQYVGSNLRITRESLPEIYDVIEEAGAILDIPRLPNAYIQEGGDINAFTAGVEQPIIVLNAGCIDHLSLDELLFVVGHEFGHIKSRHVLYHQIGMILPALGDFVSMVTLGMGGIVSTAIEVALLNWQRMSELTADRAGLLACQDRDVAISAMIKIAGLPRKLYNRFNADDFIAQAQAFQALDEMPLDKIAKVLSIMGQNHPWTVLRASEFDRWTSSGEYNRILGVCGIAGKGVGYLPLCCPACEHRLLGGESFCPVCGQKLIATSSAARSSE